MRSESPKIRCVNATGPVALVDDSDVDLEIARRVHQRSSLTNPLLPFRSGRAFLEYLDEVLAGRAEMPALVLMDINMPEISGFDTIERARADRRFEYVPFVVMLTHSDNPADIERAYGVGANGYQVKHTDVSDYVAFFDSLAADAP